MAFWGNVEGLNNAIAEYGGQAAVLVDVIANKTLGPVLAAFVILGVVACAITSGDTAFRSARLIVAYLRRRGRTVWPGLIPALIMTYVCASYIFVSPLMFGMQNRTAAYLLGGAVTLAVLVAMIFKLRNNDAESLS